ncbi:phosphoadenosine phosphosulfate reductase family protein [Promicromonospora sp. Marseille-Q5078]
MTTANPGLNLQALRALRSTTRNLELVRNRLRAHLDAHEGYVAFSGGKDSLVALHLAHQAAPDVPVVFFDSGLEYPETYTYIADLAETWDLNLHVMAPTAGSLELMASAGGWNHNAPDQAVPDMHTVLITEPAAAAHRAHGPGEVWGVRAAEARGRAAAYTNALRSHPCTCPRHCSSPHEHRAHHGGRIARNDGTVAYGPAWDWSTEEVWTYIARRHLPVNPVYAKLRRLGAPEHALRVSTMLDGSHLTEGRITWLRRGWPALFEELATVLPRLREYV